MERLDLGHPQFTQADVLNILPSLSAKNLQNWKSRGVIDSESDSPGKGNRRMYTGSGIIMLSFMSRIVEFGVPPAIARKMADRVALCAQELWNLRLDEIRPNGMHQVVSPFSSDNTIYRRGFIFKGDTGYRMEVGRKDRTSQFTPRFYAVAAIDLTNMNILNLINRHLAGLDPVRFHVADSFDDEGPAVESRHTLILSKIKTLPVDEADEHA